MVDADDVAGFGAIVATDEVIDKSNNAIMLENFVVQGMEHEIFINKEDNTDYNLFIKLYRHLEKKKIIIKKFSFSSLFSMNFKFITSDKSLLSEKSLKNSLIDFTNKIDYSKLSHLLLNYKYRSTDQITILDKVKGLKKQGGNKTKKMRKKNKKNKTFLRKRF
jgi:hypothetical protein